MSKFKVGHSNINLTSYKPWGWCGQKWEVSFSSSAHLSDVRVFQFSSIFLFLTTLSTGCYSSAFFACLVCPKYLKVFKSSLLPFPLIPTVLFSHSLGALTQIHDSKYHRYRCVSPVPVTSLNSMSMSICRDHNISLWNKHVKFNNSSIVTYINKHPPQKKYPKTKTKSKPFK